MIDGLFVFHIFSFFYFACITSCELDHLVWIGSLRVNWITSCELDHFVWIGSLRANIDYWITIGSLRVKYWELAFGGARLRRSGSSVTLGVGTVVVVFFLDFRWSTSKSWALSSKKDAACPQGPQIVSNEEPGRREGAGWEGEKRGHQRGGRKSVVGAGREARCQGSAFAQVTQSFSVAPFAHKGRWRNFRVFGALSLGLNFNIFWNFFAYFLCYALIWWRID